MIIMAYDFNELAIWKRDYVWRLQGRHVCSIHLTNEIIFSYFNVAWVLVLFLRRYSTSHFRNYSPALLEKHKDSLSQLIRRDKNRPSVIFWSIANEARTHMPDADSYFR